jgi:homoserine dehydrogenase
MPGQGGVLRIGLLGFGTVGSSFAEVLANSGHSDIRITHIYNRGIERKRAQARAKFITDSAVWTDNVDDVLQAADVDAVVELIGGLDPIGSWLSRTLAAGKHVITANKQLIAYRGPELLEVAAASGVQLLFGAAVAGGVPVIPGMVQGLSGDQIRRVRGIVNGTCNFILSSMESGANYAEVLANAQRAGYAEANPSADVDGHDARAKLCILARLALQAEIHPDDVPAQTISHVTSVDFSYAKELGATIRQVSRAQIDNGVVRARVGPMLVPKTSPIAWSRGTQNMIVTSGRFGGDVVFSGHGAGGHPTAVAVTSDVLAVAQGSAPVQLRAAKRTVSGDVRAPHYLRLVVADRPGIVAAIAGALANQQINIDAILQHRGHASDRLPFVVTTEPCLRSTLEKAVDEMNSMEFMLDQPLVLEILVQDDPDRD